jgi:hypothetical protein
VSRGQTSPVGTERLASNGYRYIKVAERGWMLKHWLIWEEANGRQVKKEEEQIRFLDGDRNNLVPSNLVSIPKGTATLRKRIAQVQAQIEERQAYLEYLQSELAKHSVSV